MTMRILTTLLLGLAWTTGALAFSSGPPDALTGAPGENTCTSCHTSFPLNSGAGMISVSGVPGSWTPLTDYDLTVTVEDGDAQRWGYEFTVLDVNGGSAGTLVLLDGDSQLSTTGGRTYAKHTSAGTRLGMTGAASWTVRWTSPSSGGGDITFYAAGNAANGDFGSFGDRIYSTSTVWSEGGLSAAGPPVLAEARLGAAFPNPFNPLTTISYELAGDMEIHLAVYALDGSLVQVLDSGRRQEGRHEVTWNGLDRSGRAMPSGVYLYRLRTDADVRMRRMTLVR
jgi:hypothetical protein